MAAGSGRGNKGVEMVDYGPRPSCQLCGGFLHSDGVKGWKCSNSDCGRKYVKHEFLKSKTNRPDHHIAGFDTEAAKKHARNCEKGSRLIVTCAQHNTQPDYDFMASLLKMAEYHKCKLAIIPQHYKNITLMSKMDKKKWDESLEPYLVASDIKFGNVIIRSDARINSTAAFPLSGKHAHCGPDYSVVFGHPQVACEPVASPSGIKAKKLYTTGSCTIANYSQTNDGMKAEFHHVHGALIIEKTRSGHCFVRQIHANDDGSFYDLDKLFTPEAVTEGHAALSLTLGDEHVMFNSVIKETFTNKDSIVNLMRPEYIVRHDVLDCYSLSHHHEKDPMTQFMKHHNGKNNIRAELDQVVDHINKTTPDYATTLIVPSNHHDHLLKAMNRIDPNKDHTNAIFIAEMQAEMRKAALSGCGYDPFYLYLSPRLNCKHEFLNRNTPYILGGVDMSQHGDVGTNGSRGSARGLAKTSYKMNIGHSHGARICQGVYQTGTSTGSLEYERGLSDHGNTHILQYKTGRRTLIDLHDGRWRL